MKKVIVIVLAVMFITVSACADYSNRISELKAEDEILEQREIQYNQILNNIRVRRIEIQGIIKELARMENEKEVKPEEADKETAQ